MKSSSCSLQLDKACAKQRRPAQPIYIYVYIHIHAYVHMSSVVSNSLQPHGSVNCPAPLSMGFPRQEFWSGLPFPSPGDLLDPGVEQIGDYQGLGVRGVRSVSLMEMAFLLGVMIIFWNFIRAMFVQYCEYTKCYWTVHLKKKKQLGCLYFYFLAKIWGMWDLNSLTRDWTCAPCSGSMES